MNEYETIRRWGKYMGSHDYYIKDQIALARRDGAPPTAIYKRHGEWVTAETIANPELRAQILGTREAGLHAPKPE